MIIHTYAKRDKTKGKRKTKYHSLEEHIFVSFRLVKENTVQFSGYKCKIAYSLNVRRKWHFKKNKK